MNPTSQLEAFLAECEQNHGVNCVGHELKLVALVRELKSQQTMLLGIYDSYQPASYYAEDLTSELDAKLAQIISGPAGGEG